MVCGGVKKNRPLRFNKTSQVDSLIQKGTQNKQYKVAVGEGKWTGENQKVIDNRETKLESSLLGIIFPNLKVSLSKHKFRYLSSAIKMEQSYTNNSNEIIVSHGHDKWWSL